MKNKISIIYLFLVKYIILKPLLQLNYIVNGVIIGKPKWYQRRFTTPVRSKWLSDTTYEITKFLLFFKI